jgi:hypothetical protein
MKKGCLQYRKAAQWPASTQTKLQCSICHLIKGTQPRSRCVLEALSDEVEFCEGATKVLLQDHHGAEPHRLVYNPAAGERDEQQAVSNQTHTHRPLLKRRGSVMVSLLFS